MVRIVSSLALKGVLEKLKPSSAEMRFDATQAILAEVKAGLSADLLILTAEAVNELQKSGQVTEARVLGSSGVGVAVRAGAKRLDIGSVDAFKRALESASSVAHSKVGASGIYFSQLIERLPLRLKKRVVVEKGPVGLAVARGEAEIGLQQLCELAPVSGIDIVGPLPAPIQRLTRFAAAIPATAADPDGARAILRLMETPAARDAMAQGGMQPA